MMGIRVPETCWASNKICNKNHLLHVVGILFPHMVLFSSTDSMWQVCKPLWHCVFNMWHYSLHQYWLFHPHILQELADPQGHNCLTSSPKPLPFLLTISQLRTVLFIYLTKVITSCVQYDILYGRIKRCFEDKIIKVKYVWVSWW
jgi:hypothetical protein